MNSKKLFFDKNKATVVNIKHGYNYDIYIGRPSIWGNPFSSKKHTSTKFKSSSLKNCLKMYKQHILNDKNLLNNLHKLKGKTLGCWCVEKNWKRKNNISEYLCHGEILLDLIDEQVK